jgi:hypothetical protein
MKRIPVALLIVLTFMTTSIVILHQVQAEVKWNTLKEIDLKTEALDIATSPDEQVLFLLSRGEVLVYSLGEEKVIERIPLDKEFDKLNYLPRTNALVLTSTSNKNLRVIMMELIQNFDITGLPHQGPENAPVTVVVFNDYQ